MSPALSRFLAVIAFTCAAVSLLFSLEAAAFGLCVIFFAVLIFSLEPFTSGIVAVLMLIGIAVFIDPIVAAGAAVVAVIAGIYGIFILIAKSNQTAKRVKEVSRQDPDL